jgi:hypothetical protein
MPTNSFGDKKRKVFLKEQYSYNSNINALFGCYEEKVRRERYKIFVVLSGIREK